MAMNVPSLAQEMAKTPKDQKPGPLAKDSPEWMQEMAAAGKQFDKHKKQFGDYFSMHPTVKELLADKERQIAEQNRKIQQLERAQSTRGGEKPWFGLHCWACEIRVPRDRDKYDK